MDPTKLQPGDRLERYELLCPLAYGGMASVWLARFGGRLGFERLVVVKMILPQYSQDLRFQKMFLDEANIASRIEHTNVARILDIGEHDGNVFLVMEWVDGDSLSKVMRAAEAKGLRVPAGVALRICADAAAGLHAAHELKDRDGTLLGVVHRDVSPQNILVSNTGATVLIDFGVAKARDRVAQDTNAGQLKGKIRYMAPEQALGHDVDRRADLWSLGAILYELFSGDAPFDAANEVTTLHKLTSGAKPPDLPASTPAPVAAVIHRALAFDPDARFATALELNLALESAIVESGETTSMALVAHYTGQLLAERKASRRKAVDAALASAKARDAAGGPRPPAASFAPPAGPVSLPPASALPAPEAPPPAPAPSWAPPAPGPGWAAPRDDARPAAEPTASLAEVPTGTSSATLGSSAAMEYRPAPTLDHTSASQRRLFATVALSVSVFAGLVGVVLIIGSTMARRRDGRSIAGPSISAPLPHGEVTEGAPPSASALPAPAATSIASASASASTAPPEAPPSASEAPARTVPHPAKPPPWRPPARPGRN